MSTNIFTTLEWSEELEKQLQDWMKKNEYKSKREAIRQIMREFFKQNLQSEKK
jgi:Arc/MetJ-type ribon-helix-helix transcriptional regulator